MSFHRASLIGGLVLGLAAFAGCGGEEAVQPPPAAAPDAAAPADGEKAPTSKPAPGSSKIDPKLSS